jgi:hypothetical protein
MEINIEEVAAQIPIFPERAGRLRRVSCFCGNTTVFPRRGGKISPHCRGDRKGDAW